MGPPTMTDAITAALDSLTEADVSAAAHAALEDCGLPPCAVALEIIGASLRWMIGAVRGLPRADLVAGALADGGRGVRGEVWREFDEERRDIELDLLVLLLDDRGHEIGSCPPEAHDDASDACEVILEDAADALFRPVVAVVREAVGWEPGRRRPPPDSQQPGARST